MPSDCSNDSRRGVLDEAPCSHRAICDDQEVYVDGILQFIRDVDAGRFTTPAENR